MQRETDVVEVRAWVSNLPRNIESTNTISVNVEQAIQEIIDQERQPVIPLLGSKRFKLKPHGFTPSHLSKLLLGQRVTQSSYLGQEIASLINNSFAKDNSLREPVFVTVTVSFIKEIYTQSWEKANALKVMKRLREEQRVELKDLVEESDCSICIENLSEGIIRMPECLHMFHQKCLFEWIGRKNSCPMCRIVPYASLKDQEADS